MKKLPVVCALAMLTLGVNAVSADILIPTPINSSPAFTGFEVGFFVDRTGSMPNLLTDYASNGAGASTFADFDFGSPSLIQQVIYTDRMQSGGANGMNPPAGGSADNVTSYDLIFRLNNSNFADTANNTVVGPIASPGFANTDPPVLLNGGAGIVARFLRFQVVTTIGANPGGADLSFVGGSAVPEPSTLLLGGLGAASLFGYAWRRRRRE